MSHTTAIYKWIIIVAAAVIAGSAIFAYGSETTAEIDAQSTHEPIVWVAASNSLGSDEADRSNDAAAEDVADELPSRVLHEVPFTSQAPLADWDDPRQQDGCEEASVLMAMHWAQEQSLSADTSLQEIIALSEFQEEQYGFYRDSNVADTARFMEAYYGFTQYSIEELEDAEQLRALLAAGAVIIAPTNGQLLHNPHFTQPGPEQHMLVITGYDLEKDVFITNDPGTRFGYEYEYATDTLLAAIQEYPSGSEHQQAGSSTQHILIVRR